jgi:hypothetical protein
MIIKKIQAYDCAEGYTISEYGDVYRNGKKLSSHLDHNGYYQIRIYNKNKKRLSVLIHRLVAFTFLDIPKTLYLGGTDKKGYTVDHVDGNKTNNHYTNLKWVDFYDNIKKNTDFEYMDDEKARLIVQDLLGLYSIKEIVEKYNVSKTLVQRIRQKQRYRHLVENIQFPTTYVHRDRIEILTIIFYTLKYSNINSVQLSKLFKEHLNIKCSSSMILNIRNNSSCKEYIKFVKNNNWKPSETIEMDKLVTE